MPKEATKTGVAVGEIDESGNIELNEELKAAFDEVEKGAATEPDLTNEYKPSAALLQERDEKRRAERLEREGIDEFEENENQEDPADKAGGSNKAVAKADTSAKAKTKQVGTEKAGDAEDEKEELDPLILSLAEKSGLNKEDFTKLHGSDPELAEKILGQLSDSYNRQTLQFAALGSTSPQAVPEDTSGKTEPTINDYLAKLDTLKDEQGGETFVADVLRPAIVQMQQMQSKLETQQAAMQAQQETAEQVEGMRIADIANTKFAQFGKSFPDFYGVKADENGHSTGKPNETQVSNQDRVAGLADQIRSGASLQGGDMSIDEALTRAHLSITATLQLEQARKQLVAQVTNRSKKSTSKPTTRQATPPGEEMPVGDEKAMEAYAALAAELGIEVGV